MVPDGTRWYPMVPDGCMATDTIAKLPMVSVVTVENGTKNGMLQGLGYRGVLHTWGIGSFRRKICIGIGHPMPMAAPDTIVRAHPSPMNRPVLLLLAGR